MQLDELLGIAAAYHDHEGAGLGHARKGWRVGCAKIAGSNGQYQRQDQEPCR
jgi:hypothetical protein